MKPLRVLVLSHPDLIPPDSVEGRDEREIHGWKTVLSISSALDAAGHNVRTLGVQHELEPISKAIAEWQPDIVFNLLEEFHGETAFDHNIASYLELLQIPYTGCNPRGLMLARSKDLSKKLVAYHQIPTPAFAVFPLRRPVRRPPHLQFPLIVKTLSEDASLGISQASVVYTDKKLIERIAFIHERIGTAAIVEEYIDGRELYVGVLGNDNLRALPVWELEFGKGTNHADRIATAKVKHDPVYQERRGILQGLAEDLTPELAARIQRTAKRIYRTLSLDGYARIDFRLSHDDIPYFLEANPNPEIAESEEFAQAAQYDGLEFDAMLERILALGIRRARLRG
jgi:D-alanine-D-alanine ligase